MILINPEYGHFFIICCDCLIWSGHLILSGTPSPERTKPDKRSIITTNSLKHNLILHSQT